MFETGMASVDDLRTELERVRKDAQQAREQLQQALLAAEGQIASLAQSALERLQTAETDLATAGTERERLTRAEEEARALTLGAQARFGDIKTELEQAKD